MKNGKSSLLLYMMTCASIILSACSENNEGNGKIITPAEASVTQANTTDRAVARTRIVIGVPGNVQPISFYDYTNKNYLGHDIDLAKEACKRAELECSFKPVLASEMEKDLVQDKTVDAIWSNLAITKERKNIFAFSTPYMKGKQVIVVRTDSPIKTKADLAGAKVIVEKGSIGEQVVRALNGAQAPAEIIASSEVIGTGQQLFSSDAHALVYDNLAMEYYVANSAGKLRIVDDPLSEDDIGVAVRPIDTELLGKLNKALTAMQADGSIGKIHANWFTKK